MRIYVGITDGDWFQYMSRTGPHEDLNFWQPSASTPFKALQPGEPFLFKLHSPRNYIVGGGFFAHFTTLPVSFAWKTFGLRNGAQTEFEMRARIGHYRRTSTNLSEDYVIGCVLLQSPFFFDEPDWVAVPDWNPNIVRGKGYDSHIEPGRSLWEQVKMRMTAQRVASPSLVAPQEQAPQFGAPQTVLPRLGQGSFRVVVTDAYGRRCAFTRSPVLHVLEAAHIKPVSQGGVHSAQNGILLRQDFHTLFDRGYLTVTPEYRVEVSRRIREEFENGCEYYSLNGERILIPSRSEFHPGVGYLKWHNENIYRG